MFVQNFLYESSGQENKILKKSKIPSFYWIFGIIQINKWDS